MDLLQTIGGDGALLLLSAAGLVATAVAIYEDTKAQRREPARESIRVE